LTFLTNDNQSTGTLTGGTYIADGANIEWECRGEQHYDAGRQRD